MTSKQKRTSKLLLLLLCLLIVFLLSLSIGYANTSFIKVLQVFLGQADTTMSLIVFKIRLPRILACMLQGASCHVRSLVANLTKNPLADSGILEQ